MKYDRYINNTILSNCRRPQRKNWCAPITVGEVIESLIGSHISIDDIAKAMNWSQEAITGGKLGTKSIIDAVTKLSKGTIKHKVLNPSDIEEHWTRIRDHIRNRLLYYHEPGHHLLICGYIEEPLILKEDVWDHNNVGSNEYICKRRWLIKAEHNLKTPEGIDQGILVPVDYGRVCAILKEKKNSDLVLFYK